MIRILAGSVASAIAMTIAMMLFWATPLDRLAYAGAPDANAAAVQTTLAQQLSPSGTGTYQIPAPYGSAQNTILYARGPIATVHFNSVGQPVSSSGGFVGGFVLFFTVSLLVGAALSGIAPYVSDFGARARLSAIFAVAASALVHGAEPIFDHYDLGWSIYNLVTDGILLALPGLILSRWFLPARIGASQ
ncbi:MAG: hypothetical protein PGN09_02610 [Sphingomonas fennica]